MASAVGMPSRARVEARLDRLVADNRFTIAVVFPATGAVLLIASAASLLPGPLNFNPYLILLGTLVMRLPLVAGLAPLIDRRAAIGIGLLTAYAYAIEFVGIPYGEFGYGIDLGPMLLGQVPLGLPIFFLPLVVNAYLLVGLLLGERADSRPVRLGTVIGVVVGMDLILDPGAVGLGFWSYGADGPYYGVPWSNYAGWVLSATVTVATLDAALDRAGLRERLDACRFILDDLVSFVILWGAINAYFGQAVPVALAALLGLGLVRADRFDVPRRSTS